MVLIILLSLNLVLGGQGYDDLLGQYNKQVHKTIKKTCNEEDFNLLQKEQGYFRIEKDSELLGYVMLAEVAACHLGGCPAFKSQELKNSNKSNLSGSEYFDVLVIVDADKAILKVKILNYFSDYGYEITSKKYLNKYKGKNLCDFKLDTDGVDAISGATISSLALEGYLGKYCE